MGDSDSENEGSQTNVSRLVIRPPGHTGKAQKGHLAFEATFESANLGKVDFVADTEYDIYIRPDTCNPRHRFWFYFSIENTQADQRIIFNLVNISKSRNLLTNGLTPVVKSTSRPRWQRMPSSHVFYHRSPAHNNAYVLSFAFCFDAENEVYQFAMCQPFTYSRHKLAMEKLMAQNYNYVHKETIGKSVFERPIDLITISSPDNINLRREVTMDVDGDDLGNDFAPKKVKVVFIMARVHPGETPSSFVIQGLLDFLVSSHDIAVSLRDHVVFKIIPMLNPDGVFLGNQRCNVVGQDLNRAWAETNKFLHSEIIEVKKQLMYYDNHSKYDLDMVLDIHAHTALTGLFIYGNSYDDVYRYERHIVFPKILSQNCEDFNCSNTIYNADQKKSGSVRRHMTTYLSNEVNTYTIEVSLLGYEDHENRQIIPYTDQLYAKVGRNITRALWDYYKIVATIPLDESSDEESGIPKPSKEAARPKSVSQFRSFNMDRFKQVEKQRQQTAQTFDDGEEKSKSDPKSRSTSVARGSSDPKQKDFVRLNSAKFRKSFSVSFEGDSLDNLSNLSLRNDNSSSGENDYSSKTESGGKSSAKVLTPIVSLELDDASHNELSRSINNSEKQRRVTIGSLSRQRSRDDVDFFFNNNNKGLNRQDTLESLFKGSAISGTKLGPNPSYNPASSPKPYFASTLSSLQISRLGAQDDDILLSQTVFKNPLGIELLPHTGHVGLGRKVGGGGHVSKVGEATLPQNLTPFLPAETPTLSVIDFSRMTKHTSLPGFGGAKKKKRKKTVVVPKGMTKEEYFSKIDHY